MKDLELEREIRATLGRHVVDILDPGALPPAREVIRRTRHRQVANVVLGLVTAAAVAAASIAGAGALLRSSEHRTPVEPPDTFTAGPLEAAPIGTYAFLDLTVASDGAVWWTGPGITRFDPASGSLRTFTVADDPAFDGIWLLAPAPDGGVWTSWKGPTRFDGERFRETLPQTAVISLIAEGPDGTVWGENAGDFFRLDGDVWMPVFSKGLPAERGEEAGWGMETPDGLPLGGVTPSMAVDAGGGLWVSFSSPGSKGFGVSRYDGTTWTTWTMSDGLPSDNVITIAPASNGDVWIGTDDGAARFRNGSWTAYPGAVIGTEGVWSIAPTEQGVVVAGHSGFARFDGTTWSPVTAADGLEGKGGRLAAGPSGVWAATRAGLFRLEGSRWERQVALEGGPLLTQSREIAAVSSEEVWAADFTSVWRLEGGAWTEYAGLPGGGVAEMMAVAPDGVPWVSTNQGLARFDGSAWEQVEPGEHDAIAFAPDGTVWRTANDKAWTVGPVGGPALPPLPNEPTESTGGMLDLAVGPHDDVWVGWTKGLGWSVEDAGLVHFEGGEWQTVVPYADRFFVRDLEVTPDGDVWVSGSALEPLPPAVGDQSQLGWGPPFLARFRDGAWTTYGKADGISGGPGQLDVTSSGEVLFATSDGLFVFRDEAWHLLQKGWFGSLSVAPDGTVWLSGDGLFRMKAR